MLFLLPSPSTVWTVNVAGFFWCMMQWNDVQCRGVWHFLAHDAFKKLHWISSLCQILKSNSEVLLMMINNKIRQQPGLTHVPSLTWEGCTNYMQYQLSYLCLSESLTVHPVIYLRTITCPLRIMSHQLTYQHIFFLFLCIHPFIHYRFRAHNI